MSQLPYKLNIKIGSSEFSAEGPEKSVKDDYGLFLEALKKAGENKPSTPLAAHLVASGSASAALGWAVGEELMARVYKRDGEIISLRHLPTTANKVADATILLIYGFMKLAGMSEVPVIKLNEGLRESGLNIDRLDRHLGVHQALYRKGGQKSGGRYTLNNQGMAQAEAWLQAWD